MGLMKCPDCGKNVSSRTTQCPFCGCPAEYYEQIDDTVDLNADEIIQKKERDVQKTERNKPTPSNSVNKNTSVIRMEGLEFPSRYKTIANIHIELSKKAEERLRIMGEYYNQNVNCFDDIESVFIPYLMDEQQEGAVFAVSLLMQLGINDITSYKLLDGMNYNSLNAIVRDFSDVIEDIDEDEAERRYAREVKKGTGAHWVGGGFGVRGAVKGAVTAGAMNIATDAFRGIGGLIQEASDAGAIKKRKQEEFDNIEFSTDVRNYYNYNIFSRLVEILIERGILEPDDLNTDDLDDVLINYREFYYRDKSVANKKRLIDTLYKCIEKDPFDEDYYTELYELDPKKKQFCLSMSDSFGIGPLFRFGIFAEEYLDKLQEIVDKSNASDCKTIRLFFNPN